MQLQTSLEKLLRGEDLEPLHCRAVMHEIISNKNPIQTAAFLVLLRAKPETHDEVYAMAIELRNRMKTVPTHHRVLDIVGTGGDGSNSINISTGSAILSAACGIKIAKHGNRSVSSLTGAADLLEALSIKIDLTPEQICHDIDTLGIGFCFSPNFHPILAELRAFRKQLRVPTSFNMLGPLLNPAHPQHSMIGVMAQSQMQVLALALQKLGTTRSVVIHGQGLDEISCLGKTLAIEIDSHKTRYFSIDPAQYHLPYCHIEDLRGGDPKTNANILLDAYAGTPGAIANTLMLNTGTALWLYGTCRTIAEGIELARSKLQDHSALTLINKWKHQHA